MKIPRMFWAGLAAWAATAVLGLTYLAAPAHAATTAPASTLGGNYGWYSGEFINSNVVSSTVTKSLYLTDNGNLGEWNIGPSDSYYQTVIDVVNNNHDCATLDWANGGKTNKVLDETCKAGEYAQEWDFLGGYGNGGGWVVGNEYLNSNNDMHCVNQEQPWLRGQTATAGLNIACPQSNGKPWNSQVFYMDAGG